MKIKHWLSINPFKRCILCQQASVLSWCDYCVKQLPWLAETCSCCGVELVQKVNFCGACLASPLKRKRTISAFRYAFPIQQMIAAFKFNAQFYYVPPLQSALYKTVVDAYAQDVLPEALIAVPLHYKKQQLRGFNQAHMLAQGLGKKLAKPLWTQVVIRQINTEAQTHLSAQERQKNILNAFKLLNVSLIQQRHIALIDDVITTGSTVEQLAKLLMEAGAARVDAWSVARA